MPVMFLFLTFFSTTSAQFDRSQCGSLKGCLSYPLGCQSNCKMYFSYVQEVDYLNMEIFGKIDTSQQAVYYAIGFSNDAGMGDDLVVFCRYMPSMSPQVSVGLAYNGQQEGSNSIINSQNVQLVNSTTVINGGIYCQFKQSIVPNVQGLRNLNDSYYILAATGTPQNDGSLSYHASNRAVFTNKVDLRQYIKSGSSVIVVPIQGTGVEPFSLNRTLKDWLKIIHAIFMTVSWSILLATGILFARHFKDHWPESTACGVKMWFAYHRSLNSIGLLLSILGVVAIFWSFEWTWMGPQPGWTMAENTSVGPMHCLFGALAIIIGCIQPFNALFRCKPGSGARFIFNWIHRLIGILGFLCAMVAITLPALGFNTMFYSLDAATALWFAYLAVLIVTEIILEALKMKKFCGNTSTSLVIPEKSDGAASSAPVSGFSNAQSYVLLLFVLLSLVLITAFCVLIFLKPVRSG